MARAVAVTSTGNAGGAATSTATAGQTVTTSAANGAVSTTSFVFATSSIYRLWLTERVLLASLCRAQLLLPLLAALVPYVTLLLLYNAGLPFSIVRPLRSVQWRCQRCFIRRTYLGRSSPCRLCRWPCSWSLRHRHPRVNNASCGDSHLITTLYSYLKRLTTPHINHKHRPFRHLSPTSRATSTLLYTRHTHTRP